MSLINPFAKIEKIFGSTQITQPTIYLFTENDKLNSHKKLYIQNNKVIRKKTQSQDITSNKLKFPLITEKNSRSPKKIKLENK
jgi:hypothetical protein